MIPRIIIPKDVRDEAWSFADRTVDSAMHALGTIVLDVIHWRRSYAFAVRKALYHQRLVETMPTIKPRLSLLERRVRRHQRLAMHWEAKAYSRTPDLASACGLKCTSAAV